MHLRPGFAKSELMRLRGKDAAPRKVSRPLIRGAGEDLRGGLTKGEFCLSLKEFVEI